MFFNDDNKHTNIDEEFDDVNIVTKLNLFYKKYELYILILLAVIILILLIITFPKNKVTYYLVLNGEENIVLYQGDDYIEPGFVAYSSKNENLNNNVSISSTLDVSKIGEYEIIYTIDDITLVRKITVVERPEEYIYLVPINNSIDVYLQKGDDYIEPGYYASIAGENLTENIKVVGEVDTTKRGEYTLLYTVIGSNGETISATRTVYVMDIEVNYTLSPNVYTNKDVTIKMDIKDQYFNYVILPNGNKVMDSSLTYKVSSNGTYKFTVYNSKGISKEENVVIKNIDKTAPTGSCKLESGTSGSIINITASDSSGISKYVYNNKTYTSNKISLSSYVDNVSVIIYDKAGNSKNISCKAAKPIAPVITSITNDGVIVNIEAKKVDTDIAGYYFSYTNKMPTEKDGYLATSKTSIDVVRLPGTTYVWVKDKSGRVSSVSTIDIPVSSLLMTKGNNYKILKGTKLSDYLTNKGWSIEGLNKLIARSVRAAGLYSKVGAATAAISLQTVLAQKYGIKLPYESAGIYRKYGADPRWGKYGHNYITDKDGYYGMDCSAFVTWTYYQTGYSITNLNPAYWAGWKKIAFSKENGDIGDILVTNSNKENRHVKLIVAKTKTGFITAEASGGTYGMIVATHSYSSPGGFSIQKGENFNSLFSLVSESKYPSGF